MLLDISNLHGATKDTRQILSEDDSLTIIKAIAVLHKSRVQKALFSIYGIIYKPKLPIKFL